MKFKTLTLAAGALMLSAGIASAATVTNDLNLRSGPGTRYGVIDTMPAGAYVNVIGCGGSWCRVDWHGRVGYASASYLGGGRGAYAAAPVYARRRRWSASGSVLAVVTAGMIGTGAIATAAIIDVTTNRIWRQAAGRVTLSGLFYFRFSPATARAIIDLAARTPAARPN